jgi:hypothetical protein
MEPTQEPTISQAWQQINTAMKSLGDLAQQVERSLAPTAKQEYVERLSIGLLLAELVQNTGQLQVLWDGKITCDTHARRYKEQLDELKSMILISGTIDGKNAEIRDAQLAVALKADPGYQDAKQDYDDTISRGVSIDADLEHARAIQSMLKIRARLLTAQLEYLAGER